MPEKLIINLFWPNSWIPLCLKMSSKSTCMYPCKDLYISLLNSLTLCSLVFTYPHHHPISSLISLIDFISLQGVSGSNQRTVCVAVRFASPAAPTRFWAPTRGPNSAAASGTCATTTYRTSTRVSHRQRILSPQVVMS